GTPASHVIDYGRSVGGGPALDLATRKPLRALILESCFTDPASVRVPVRIRSVQLPVLVMHGLADELIPASHGQALYAAAPGPKFCLWVGGAGHDDLK